MRVTDSMISSLKTAYERETGEQLTASEARAAATRLYQFLQMAIDVMSQLDAASLAKFRARANVKEKSSHIADK